MGPGLIQRYRAFLPVTDRTPVVSLGEGSTPLLRAKALEAWLGCRAEIYLKEMMGVRSVTGRKAR